jgi:hypothetical protein
MNRFISIAALVFFICSANAGDYSGLVKISANVGSGGQAYSTGFFAENRGFIITAGHAFAPYDGRIPKPYRSTAEAVGIQMNAEFFPEGSWKSSPHHISGYDLSPQLPLFAEWSTFLPSSSGLDLAVVANKWLYRTPPRSSFELGPDVVPAPGDAVWTVAYVGGQGQPTRYNGHYVGTYSDRPHLLVFSLSSFGGMSGGPIVHERTGKVIAVLNGPAVFERDRMMDAKSSWLPWVAFDSYGTAKGTYATKVAPLAALPVFRTIQIVAGRAPEECSDFFKML